MFWILSIAFSPIALLGQVKPDKTMVITIDDLPFSKPLLPHQQDALTYLNVRTDKILEALKAQRVPAIGFVNESKLLVRNTIDGHLKLLEKWLLADMELGNHTFSHPSLSRTPLEAYQADVLRGEVLTKWLCAQHNKSYRYFRFPYNHRGPTKEIRDEFEAFLKRHQYIIAPFTVEHSDYVFNQAYVKAVRAGNSEKAEKIKVGYVEYLAEMLGFFEDVSHKLFQRVIPQILLIHTNEINADTMQAMLALMVSKGYRFVSLDEALKDPAYQTPDGFVGRFGPSWLHRFSLSLGVKPVVRNGKEFPAYLLQEPEPPDWLRDE